MVNVSVLQYNHQIIIQVTFLCFLLYAVVTGATYGIGKAYACEVSLQLPSTTIPHTYLVFQFLLEQIVTKPVGLHVSF